MDSYLIERDLQMPEVKLLHESNAYRCIREKYHPFFALLNGYPKAYRKVFYFAFLYAYDFEGITGVLNTTSAF